MYGNKEENTSKRWPKATFMNQENSNASSNGVKLLRK